jgi:two-component system, chemotaxis family, protein-glutamate methylesterase/glutaminase
MRDEQTPWIVAIGASGAQGLDDIVQLLVELPGTLSAILMVVLHRRWHQPTKLRAILAKNCALPVMIAVPGERFEVGVVYIGEPAVHLTLATDIFGGLIDDPSRHHGGRTVDLLFKWIATHAGRRMIGVVLSGSLDDGSRGLAAIHKAGGLTMVLTPAGARSDRGMPENAINYDGPISLVGNPRQLAQGICMACAAQIPTDRVKTRSQKVSAAQISPAIEMSS